MSVIYVQNVLMDKVERSKQSNKEGEREEINKNYMAKEI
jgi:hypothetical protein